MTSRTSPIRRRGYGHPPLTLLAVHTKQICFVCTAKTENRSGGGEPDDAERGQGEGDGLGMAVPRDAVGPDLAAADATPAELGGVGVEDLGPAPGDREPEPVAVARDRRQVGDTRDRPSTAVRIEAQERI